MLKKFPDGQNQVFIMASQSKGHIHKFQFVEKAAGKKLTFFSVLLTSVDLFTHLRQQKRNYESSSFFAH